MINWWLSRAAYASFLLEVGVISDLAQFQLFFESPQLFFPYIERGAMDLLVPSRGDHILEPFLLNPDGAKSKWNGTQIFTHGQLEKYWFMIQGVDGKDFGGCHKIKSKK